MKESAEDLNLRIAQRVRELRAEHRLSLDVLARRSGVSRSMISLIERGESSPTAVILGRLAVGLGVTLASLFEPTAGAAKPPRESPLLRRDEQPQWKDPASGYLRRNVSPKGSPVQIVEVHFPAGGRVAFEGGTRAHQQIWLLEGSMDITAGKDRYRLRAGDSLAMRLDLPVMFHNPTRKRARYAVAIAPEPFAAGS